MAKALYTKAITLDSSGSEQVMSRPGIQAMKAAAEQLEREIPVDQPVAAYEPSSASSDSPASPHAPSG